MRGSFSPLFAGLVLIAACNGNKVGPEENVAVEDTVMTDSVNVELEGDSTEVTPVAVDGLFDDFVYSFMHNRKFQMQRIVFPCRMSRRRLSRRSSPAPGAILRWLSRPAAPAFPRAT